MSEHAETMQTRHFLLRRLHSLTGIVPVGVFLIAHLTTNSTIAWGGLNSRADGVGWLNRAIATFQHEVSYLNNLPMLLIIEVTLWSALGFHAILGIYYAMSGSNNVSHYKYGGNLRYTLQRLTGYFGFLFIFYHVATLRWGWTFLVPGGVTWSHENASSTLAAALQGSTDGFTGWGLAVSIFYFIGVSALVFHFANGLWSAAITWGITISRPAQKRWGMVCAGVGAGLMLMAWASVIGFATLDYDQANTVEEAMQNPQIHLDDTDAIETASVNEHKVGG